MEILVDFAAEDIEFIRPETTSIARPRGSTKGFTAIVESTRARRSASIPTFDR